MKIEYIPESNMPSGYGEGEKLTSDGEWIATWRYQHAEKNFRVWDVRGSAPGRDTYYATRQEARDEMFRRAMLIRMTK